MPKSKYKKKSLNRPKVILMLFKELSFEERAVLCKNVIGKKLFEIMALKKTNLCVAADYTSFDQLLQVFKALNEAAKRNFAPRSK